MPDDPDPHIRAQIEDAYLHDHYLKDKQICRLWCEWEYSGQVFVSHSAKDSAWCRPNIVWPIHQAFGPHSFFFLSSASQAGQRERHFALVEFAFRYCKTVVTVISDDSVRSNWVGYEARWAIEQQHPIILCLKDDIDPARLRHEYGEAMRPYHAHLPIELIDFKQDLEGARQRLIALLKGPPFEPEPSPIETIGLHEGMDGFFRWCERKNRSWAQRMRDELKRRWFWLRTIGR